MQQPSRLIHKMLNLHDKDHLILFYLRVILEPKQQALKVYKILLIF